MLCKSLVKLENGLIFKFVDFFVAHFKVEEVHVEEVSLPVLDYVEPYFLSLIVFEVHFFNEVIIGNIQRLLIIFLPNRHHVYFVREHHLIVLRFSVEVQSKHS